MATWLIRKLGLGPTFKWPLIITIWLLTTTYIVTDCLTIATFSITGELTGSKLAFVTKTGHQILAYCAVFLLLFHLNVLNKNTIKLANRIEQKRNFRLLRSRGTFTVKSEDLDG